MKRSPRRKKRTRLPKKISKRKFIAQAASLIKKYGKVRITHQNVGAPEVCSCMCKQCKSRFESENLDMRRRVITAAGECQVSYKSEGYAKWSSYSESCFMGDYSDLIKGYCNACQRDEIKCNCTWHEQDCEYTEPDKTPEQTLKFMLAHDAGEGITPVLIEYGPRFCKQRKIRL